MSRTNRAEWQKHWYNRENAWARRLTRRLERNRARQLMRHDQHDLADTR